MIPHQEKKFIRGGGNCPRRHRDLPQEMVHFTVDLSMFSLEHMEKCAIEQVLRLCGNNKSRTSQILGISRESLYCKMHKYGIPL
ncbi:MAG: helix-turn-helix domain-containing protein [Acidobacteria bacterium]|nr:helix-turn-helix domain-containing protein [Acidobacteriota bacterium]